MADLYVLEGRGRHEMRAQSPTNHPIRPRTYPIDTRRVPGIVYGDPLAMLGMSLNPMKAVRSAAHAVASTARSTTKAVANASSFVARPVAHAVAQTARVTQHDVLRPAAHGVMTAERVTVKAVGQALDVTKRVAKRVIKGIAKKVLFHGGLLGSSAVAAVPKNAAKGLVIPAATAAILANPVTAPAAPVVPVLVNEVIDELYNTISDGIAKGLSPADAAKKAQSDLDKLEPGEESDPKVGSGLTPWLIGGGLAVGLFIFLRRR